MAETNAEINRRITAKSDHELYGVEERWTYPSSANQGDCEDYALLKRKLLHERTGIELGNLLLTVVRKRDGEGHAILTLRTQRGEFILDNLDRRVVVWRDTPYRFLKRQSSPIPADGTASKTATRRWWGRSRNSNSRLSSHGSKIASHLSTV